MSFVITGILESLQRNQAYALIQQLGGTISNCVTASTGYLEPYGEDEIKLLIIHT